MTTKLPNAHKIYPMVVKYYKWPECTYNNIFHSKVFLNILKVVFWSEKKPSGNPGKFFGITESIRTRLSTSGEENHN
jgi:hypothetical protein